jgi:hypothetical protein
MGWNVDDYVDVAERLKLFKEKYPEGSLQQVRLEFIEFAGKSWVVYTAAARRHHSRSWNCMGTCARHFIIQT